jgi:hypothetical protein
VKDFVGHEITRDHENRLIDMGSSVKIEKQASTSRTYIRPLDDIYQTLKKEGTLFPKTIVKII